MQQNEFRKTMTARFYQSLADSDVEIRSIPQKELQALVHALADSVFDALGSLEEEADQSPGAGVAPADEEVVLWTGRPYLSLGVRYELTNQRIRIIRGLLGRSVEEVELVRVQDTSSKQHMGERALNVGDVTVMSHDPNMPELVLHNVKNPNDVREQIRKAVLAERERRKLHFREEM